MEREEAIEKVRQMSLPKETMEILEALAPELKESEDERIRKWIYTCIENLGYPADEQAERELEEMQPLALAYLEKQKESLHISETCKENSDSFTDEDEKIRKVMLEHFKSKTKETWCGLHVVDIVSFLEKQKSVIMNPHKGDDGNPYDMGVSEAQDYAINRGFAIPFNDGEVFVDGRYITQTIGNIIRWADEHPKDQKPAECIEDSVKFEEGFKAGRESGLRDGQKYVLDNLDSYGLCKPAEWCEEDEEMLVRLLDSISIGNDYKEMRNWLLQKLKSLRPQSKQIISKDTEVLMAKLVNLLKSYRIEEETATALANRIADTYGAQRYMDGLCDGEKLHWKPSEEQMKALQNAIDACESEWVY